jgi:hypothetical protein
VLAEEHDENRMVNRRRVLIERQTINLSTPFFSVGYFNVRYSSFVDKFRKTLVMVCMFLFCLSVLASLPQAYATLSYSWNDATSTVTVSGSGTTNLATLRTQDRAASLSHELLDYAVFTNGEVGQYSLTYSIRALDDLALQLEIVVTAFNVEGMLTVSGLDRFGNAQSEQIDINGLGTFKTANYYAYIIANGISSDGTLDCILNVYQDRWGLIGAILIPYQTGPAPMQSYIWAGGIEIGSGVALTQTLSLIYLRTVEVGGATELCNYYLQVDSGGTATFGTLQSSVVKSTSSGCGIESMSATTKTAKSIYNNGGTLNIYGTVITVASGTVDTLVSGVGSTTRIYNSVFYSIDLAGTGYDVFNLNDQYSTGSPYALDARSQTLSGTFNNLKVTKAQYVIGITHSVGADTTLSNLYSRNGTYLLYAQDASTNFAYNVWLINPDIDYWKLSTNTYWKGKLYRQYTFDLTVTYPNGTVIQNANATLTYSGQKGGKVGSWLTDSNGQIPTQTLTMGFYNYTGGNTIYSYNPYNLTVVYGSYFYTKLFTLQTKTNWEIASTHQMPEFPTLATSQTLYIPSVIPYSVNCSLDHQPYLNGSLTQTKLIFHFTDLTWISNLPLWIYITGKNATGAIVTDSFTTHSVNSEVDYTNKEFATVNTNGIEFKENNLPLPGDKVTFSILQPHPALTSTLGFAPPQPSNILTGLGYMAIIGLLIFKKLGRRKV